MESKLFLGPMSKNIVDAAIEFNNETDVPITFIPSRRQVDYDGGYVNGWTTETFQDYVDDSCIQIERDHGGKYQGKENNNWWRDDYISYAYDCEFFDMIHIDPWKGAGKGDKFFDIGIDITINDIRACHAMDSFVKFEVGTEEALYPMTPVMLNYMMERLYKDLPLDIYEKIVYIVIQSGTSLEGTRNIGKYSEARLKEMILVAKKWGKKTKEHNGDYLPVSQIHDKFALGLDAINIAPELGVIETDCYLNNNIDLLKFNDICYKSGKWKKWVKDDTEISLKDRIRICGHYVFSTPEFQDIKPQGYDEEVKDRIKTKLKELSGV